MNIFEQATRQAYRYPSVRGPLDTESLWHLPLTHKSGCDLDSVAKAVNSELKAVTEESFVATTNNAAKTHLETKLEIVKHIIAVKLAEAEAAATAAKRTQERTKLLEALDRANGKALENLTPEEIQARIDALSGS